MNVACWENPYSLLKWESQLDVESGVSEQGHFENMQPQRPSSLDVGLISDNA